MELMAHPVAQLEAATSSAAHVVDVRLLQPYLFHVDVLKDRWY